MFYFRKKLAKTRGYWSLSC